MGRGPCARPVRVAFLTLLSCAAASPAQPPPAGVPAALAVRDGGCTCVLPTDRADSQYYLVVGCLARGPGPFRVRVRTEPVAMMTASLVPMCGVVTVTSHHHKASNRHRYRASR